MSITNVNGTDQRAVAEDEWLRRARLGEELTGRDLAGLYGHKERWGQERVKAARARLRSEPAPRLPGEVPLDGFPADVPIADALSDDTIETPVVTSHAPHNESHGEEHAPHADRTPTPAEALESLSNAIVDDGYRTGDRAVTAPSESDRTETAQEPHADRTPTAHQESSSVNYQKLYSAPKVTPHASTLVDNDEKHVPMHMHHKERILRTFYGFVLVLALIGQTTGAAKWVPVADAPADATWQAVAGIETIRYVIALVFSLVLELGGLVMLLEVVSRSATGDRSRFLPLVGAFAFTAAAGGITFVGHWGDNPARPSLEAWAFLLVTLAGLVTLLIQMDWRVRPEHQRRHKVEEAVRTYVRTLDMPEPDKKVLLASVDADEIARRITRGLDNAAIAVQLSNAIDPNSWRTQDEVRK